MIPPIQQMLRPIAVAAGTPLADDVDMGFDQAMQDLKIVDVKDPELPDTAVSMMVGVPPMPPIVPVALDTEVTPDAEGLLDIEATAVSSTAEPVLVQSDAQPLFELPEDDEIVLKDSPDVARADTVKLEHLPESQPVRRAQDVENPTMAVQIAQDPTALRMASPAKSQIDPVAPMGQSVAETIVAQSVMPVLPKPMRTSVETALRSIMAEEWVEPEATQAPPDFPLPAPVRALKSPDIAFEDTLQDVPVQLPPRRPMNLPLDFAIVEHLHSGPALKSDVTPPNIVVNSSPSLTVAAPLPKQLLPHVDAARSGPVEVLLQPAELGHVKFQIHQQGEAVRVVISVERTETMELLRRNSDQLIQEFRQAGFGGVDLSFGQWKQQESAPSHPEELREGDALFADLPPPILQKSAPHRSGTGLDLRL